MSKLRFVLFLGGERYLLLAAPLAQRLDRSLRVINKLRPFEERSSSLQHLSSCIIVPLCCYKKKIVIQPIQNIKLPNTISIDVEQYYHAANLSRVAPRQRWPYLPSRIIESITLTLALLKQSNTKATFFVLGTVARRNKQLVRSIAEAGHEIASHGFRHQLAYEQTPRAFYRDVASARKLLEDISGTKVIGYRAPNFSITDQNPWAHDLLFEAGYRYDSSVFPTKHPRYSNLDKPKVAYFQSLERQRKLVVFPLAVAQLNVGTSVFPCPVGGGAYWRLLPRSYIKWGLDQLKQNEIPANCYLHPWEIDAQQPVFADLSPLTKLRHYGGTKTFARRFLWFVQQYNFTSCAESFRLICKQHPELELPNE